MDEKSINRIVSAIGVSATVVTTVLVVGLGFMIYKNYVELSLTKLQIAKISKELNSSN